MPVGAYYRDKLQKPSGHRFDMLILLALALTVRSGLMLCGPIFETSGNMPIALSVHTRTAAYLTNLGSTMNR